MSRANGRLTYAAITIGLGKVFRSHKYEILLTIYLLYLLGVACHWHGHFGLDCNLAKCCTPWLVGWFLRDFGRGAVRSFAASLLLCF